MALSEEELRLLKQLEDSLAEEDPKLANALSGRTPRRIQRRTAALSGVVFLVGIIALISGMQLHNALVSVLGFVIMLTASVVALNAWKQVGDNVQNRQVDGLSATARERQFMDRMEERWRKRSGEGL